MNMCHVYITILYILHLIFVPECDALYARGTYKRLNHRMVNLMRELYLDADAKLESILYMQRHLRKDNLYHLGELIYNIRVLYKKLIRQFTKEFNAPRFVFGRESDDAIARRIAELAATNRRVMHIDNMVQMVVEFDNTDPSGAKYGRRAAEGYLPIEINSSSSGLEVQQTPEQGQQNRSLENKKQIDRMKSRKQMRLKLLQGFENRNLSKEELRLESGFDSDKN